MEEETDETLRALEYALDTHTRLLTAQLADRREELGHVRLAAGYRWLAERGKLPHFTALGFWSWLPVRDFGDWRKGSFLLPDGAYKLLPQEWNTFSPNGWNHSASAAMRAAAEAVGRWLEETEGVVTSDLILGKE